MSKTFDTQPDAGGCYRLNDDGTFTEVTPPTANRGAYPRVPEPEAAATAEDTPKPRDRFRKSAHETPTEE